MTRALRHLSYDIYMCENSFHISMSSGKYTSFAQVVAFSDRWILVYSVTPKISTISIITVTSLDLNMASRKFVQQLIGAKKQRTHQNPASLVPGWLPVQNGQ